VHISGLEVEGSHPRALMESALVPLKQVIGLLRPSSPSSGLRQAALAASAITVFTLAVSKKLLSTLLADTVHREPARPR
jgi:hypothetical protein